VGPRGPAVKTGAGTWQVRVNRRRVGKLKGLLYALCMLTKVAIVLFCLVLLFGLGRKSRPGQARRTTNLLLGLIVALLVLTLITSLMRG
jgi:fumarate reductase subunit C